LQYPTEGTERE